VAKRGKEFKFLEAKSKFEAVSTNHYRIAQEVGGQRSMMTTPMNEVSFIHKVVCPGFGYSLKLREK
jgi:hypothetical protein